MTDIKALVKYEIGNGNLDKISLDKFLIGHHLTDLVTKNDNLLSPVINGILYVESDGKVNIDGMKGGKRINQLFKHHPLKGLKKVHIRTPSIQSLAINLNLTSQISHDLKNPMITENDLATLVEDYKKLEDAHKILCFKRKMQSITGSWLIYGEINNTRYYLHVHTGLKHGSESDSKIYEKLKENYSKEFLNQFLVKEIE